MARTRGRRPHWSTRTPVRGVTWQSRGWQLEGPRVSGPWLRVWGGNANALSHPDVSFSYVVKTQRRWSNKIYKTKLTKTRYNNQVLGKYRVDPQRVGLTLIGELTWSNLGLKGVLNKRK